MSVCVCVNMILFMSFWESIKNWVCHGLRVACGELKGGNLDGFRKLFTGSYVPAPQNPSLAEVCMPPSVL
jgi:hypothetical protein